MKRPMTFLNCISCYLPAWVVSSQSDFVLTANERQPGTNCENNGNEYVIIGAVVHSEYSNIRYKHLIIGNV